MRALIMILILMDYIKKGECCSNTCQNGGTCTGHGQSNTCKCQSGYHGKNCEKTKVTLTPPATSSLKTTTTIMSTSTEEKSTAASTKTVTDTTYSTQKSSAPTTDIAETTLNPSTNGSTRVITSPTVLSSITEAEPSTQSEEATSSPLLEAPSKSVPVSVIAGSIGGIVLIVLPTIGLVILFRKRKRRKARENDTIHKSNIHCNPAYNEHCDSLADNVSASSIDSRFGKHDESVETEMMDGEYNTLRLHFPVTNETQDNTHNHIDGSLTAESTYSHITNSKDALFDNTYSHMANITHGKLFEPQDKDATYNHLGDTCSSKRKGKTEETRDDTYNHAQMSHVCPTAEQEDHVDNYSHINISGLKAQMPTADEHRGDAQEPTRTNAKTKHVTKIVDKGKQQHGDAGKGSTTTAEGENKYEGHTYFVLESNTDQHPKQAPYDYALAAAPEKDHTEFTVVETDTQHEYFVLEPTTEL